MKIDTGKLYGELEVTDKSTDFVRHTLNYFDCYQNFLNSIGCDREIQEKVNNFKDHIMKCLMVYNMGNHNEAYTELEKAFSSLAQSNLFRNMEKGTYYRARIARSNERYEANQIYHIAYEKRYLVTTERYSYPGYPCLYLGSTYDVCCEEVGNSDPGLNIAYVEYQDEAPNNVTLLDTCFFEKYNFENLSQKEYNDFLLYWPLTAMCSFHYTDTKDMRFRQDYVIPQMLLEMIMTKNAYKYLQGNTTGPISGIRYCSVHKLGDCFQRKTRFSDNMNYVLPVVGIRAKGLCPELQKRFVVKKIKLLSEIQNNS